MKTIIFLLLSLFLYSCGDNPTAPSNNNNQNQPVLIYSKDTIIFSSGYPGYTLENLNLSHVGQITFDCNPVFLPDTLFVQLHYGVDTKWLKFTNSPISKNFAINTNISDINFQYNTEPPITLIITNFKVYKY